VDMTDMASLVLEARQAVADKVGRACSDVGFFYAQNHPVPQDIIDQTFETVAKYFAQPEEAKMENHIHKRANFRGFEPLYETKLDPTSRGDMKESFLAGFDETDGNQNLPFPPVTSKPSPNHWPANSDELRLALTRYYNHLHAFSRQLVRIFALSLGIPETYFDSISTFPMAFVRPLHYPPQEIPEGDEPGIAAHTDFACFTVLCQHHVEALEVLNKNGIWIPAPPIPRTFVVNIADFMQLLTNHRFESTVHRVVNKTGKERYSIPFFFAFNEDAELEVVPSCREDGVEYGKTRVGEYIKNRLVVSRYKHPGPKASS
jgi:isopenicillin N synthase-like dioxygenase